MIYWHYGKYNKMLHIVQKWQSNKKNKNKWDENHENIKHINIHQI